jgi:3-deoxy-7-phosphoheptulonate synthase
VDANYTQSGIVLHFTGLERHGMRDSWRNRFAETPDVLKSARCQQTVVSVLHLKIGGGEFVTMAGPCSVETEDQLMATAHRVCSAGASILRGGAFKPRSSPYAFQGHGLKGLKMLARAREATGLAIVTEVMSEDDVPLVAEYADILQIGSRNMENFCTIENCRSIGKACSIEARPSCYGG